MAVKDDKKKTRAITTRGQTVVDDAATGVETADDAVIDDGDVEAVRGRTMPPPRQTMPSSEMPNPDRFPNTLVAIAEGSSPAEAAILSRALGVETTPEVVVIETGRQAPEPTERTRFAGIRASITEELGDPEEPAPLSADVGTQNASSVSTDRDLSKDTWNDVRVQQGAESAAENNPLADLPLPETDEAQSAPESATGDEPVAEKTADEHADETVPEDLNDTIYEIPKTPFILLTRMDGKVLTAGPKAEVGKELIIGRDNDCGLVVSSKHVSRHHAEVTRSKSGDKFVIIDLGSASHTLVNDFIVERDQEFELGHGDKIRFGTMGKGAELVFLDPMHQAVVATPVTETDVVADAVIDNQPAESASAGEPEKEAVVTKVEQHAETQPLDTGSVAGVADASPLTVEAKAEPAAEASAKATPPSKEDKAKGSPWLTVLIIAAVVVCTVVGIITYMGHHKRPANPAIVASEVQKPMKPAFSQFSAVEGEAADQVNLAVPVPKFEELRKMAKPEGFDAPKESPIKVFADGTEAPKSFADCFPRGAKLKAVDVAWCCANLHQNPGRLDELIRMTDCLARLEEMQY
ncbi:MAG: FHA domain-containing protein [Candidatus Magasanikbacteria bacterium]|nr:FHA domain-containing protein [Candidatus Magasanikbacteria bacterium]